MSRRTNLIIYNKEVGVPIESSGHTNHTNTYSYYSYNSYIGIIITTLFFIIPMFPRQQRDLMGSVFMIKNSVYALISF